MLVDRHKVLVVRIANVHFRVLFRRQTAMAAVGGAQFRFLQIDQLQVDSFCSKMRFQSKW